jgi:hypothetical protein
MWTAFLLAAVTGLGEPAAPAPEPTAYFQEIAERYRGLTAYSDEAQVVEVVTRPGAEPHRVESRIACRLEGEKLSVRTPGDQIAEGLNLASPTALSPAMEALVRRYNLWLAPHLALHFAADPLKDLRLGVPQGFVAATSEIVPAGEGKSTVRLELRSAEPPAEGGEPAAVFSFWIDPESKLIRRVGGRQTLPDETGYELTLEIAPQTAE